MRDHFLPGTANFEKLFEDVITETSGDWGDSSYLLLTPATLHTSGVCLCRHGAQHCDIITRDTSTIQHCCRHRAGTIHTT